MQLQAVFFLPYSSSELLAFVRHRLASNKEEAVCLGKLLLFVRINHAPLLGQKIVLFLAQSDRFAELQQTFPKV